MTMVVLKATKADLSKDAYLARLTLRSHMTQEELRGLTKEEIIRPHPEGVKSVIEQLLEE